jgi:(E)-4-hydroxy-3-methylbut-2-enyl-diphosphate synthase
LDLPAALRELSSPKLTDTPPEGILVKVSSRLEIASAMQQIPSTRCAVLELHGVTSEDLEAESSWLRPGTVILQPFFAGTPEILAKYLNFVRERSMILAAEVVPSDFYGLAASLQELGDANLIITQSRVDATTGHAIGGYRQLAAILHATGCKAPLWIRNTTGTAVQGDNSFLSKLLEASILTGSLLCDGLGDLVSIETEPDVVRATKLAYNVLQGAGARISKTEFVACPSCGRTLFDLQSTTQRIRAQTGHLKGVKIAIMGCIVNGPGEMADADFGYVGGAPGKINLYVGKNCVQYNLPQAEADARLIALIREHGKWADPEPHHLAPA